MKMKRFHKLLVSIGLSAALTFGMTSAAFADTTTATLQPVETSGNTDSRVTSGDAPAASAAYYPSYSNSGIRQTESLAQCTGHDTGAVLKTAVAGKIADLPAGICGKAPALAAGDVELQVGILFVIFRVIHDGAEPSHRC